MHSILLRTMILTLALSACSDSNNNKTKPPEPNPQPTITYSAELRRTEYGIPHIKAEDWGSLGYGFGYAYAQDNFCIVMREIVFATGRSAELMGESECPIADVVLVPSQSTDPESPHFADQTKLYSNKQWLRFPFCEQDIAAAQIGETLVLEE